MRFTLYLIAFMCYSFSLSCAEDLPENQQFQPKIAPLLSLTEKYPITIDSNNRMNLLENPQSNLEEAKRNVYLWRLKTIPWKELLAVLLFVSIAAMIKLKPKSPESVSQIDQELNAQKKGLQSLEIIQNLLKKQNYEQFYLQLTDTVRRFIEERYQIKASIKTTEEFLQEMTQYPTLDPKTQNLLSEFLQRADQVKFAEHQPSSKECEEAYKAAETLISYPNT